MRSRLPCPFSELCMFFAAGARDSRFSAWFLAQNIEYFFIAVAGRRGYFVRAVKTLAGMAQGERCRQSSFSWQAYVLKASKRSFVRLGDLDLALGHHVA